MSSLVIWIEKQESKIFQLNPEGVSKTKVTYEGPHHGQDPKLDEEKFYSELAHKLQTMNSNEWFIMGPGLAKDHFIHYLAKHHSHMTDNIRGSAKKDIMTDNQIIQEGALFFRHAHVFSGT
ncbi:MAG TPA: hypothetical protein VN132_11855 [Bdellovibrio sp.]|nr:hypothetical protein [Bdellovibrio sp.]